MHVLAATTTCHTQLNVSTERPTQFVDLTPRILSFVRDSGIHTGFVNIQTLHTTTAVVVNEHEPLLLADFRAVLEAGAPDDGRYRHDDLVLRTVNLTDEERRNGHAHCRALVLPTSVCLNISGGRLILGRWQRVFFVELDGAREREISIPAFGEAWR